MWSWRKRRAKTTKPDTPGAETPQSSGDASKGPWPEENALADAAKGAAIGGAVGGSTGAVLGGLSGLLRDRRDEKDSFW